jgi:hypothetical protein
VSRKATLEYYHYVRLRVEEAVIQRRTSDNQESTTVTSSRLRPRLPTCIAQTDNLEKIHKGSRIIICF